MGLASLLPRAWTKAEPDPRRAVIDIGSNSLRLVVWTGPARTPVMMLNEKVAANLGRTLSKDGLLPRKARTVALAGLARFALLLRLLAVGEVRVVATAAVRDAANGPAFLDEVRALGLQPELLSGAAEAEASAMGVLAAFPGACGLVGDLGGGSLELVALGPDGPARGDSLPWGTLRLPALRAKGPAVFEKTVRDALARGRWVGAAAGETLYLVGGSWRALTFYAMHEDGSPLVDPHGYALTPERAARLAETIAAAPARRLAEVPRLPGSRIASLPDAAALLAQVVRQLKPARLVTSAYGLREGLLFAALDPATRAEDPLLVAIRAQAAQGPATAQDGDALAAWIAPAFPDDPPADVRLRLAACLLATLVEAAGREARAQRALELALYERWIGLDAAGRAMLAAALLTEAGERTLPDAVARLCDARRLARAIGWGLAMRLARKLSGGVAGVLARSGLAREPAALVLALEPALAPLFGDAAAQAHQALAADLGLTAVRAPR